MMVNTDKRHIRGKGLIISLTLAAIMATAAFTAAVPAFAEPESADLSSLQSQVDSLRAEVSSINLAAEQAVERYNAANIELEGTRQQIAQNQAALDEAVRKLDEARARLEKRLVDIYRDGSMSFVEVIMSTSSFNDFMSRFDMLGKISDQDRADVEAVLNYKTEVENARAVLQANLSKQEELLAALATEKAAVESQLAARRSVLAGAEGEAAQLLAQQMQQEQAAPGSAPTTGGSPGEEAGPPADDDDGGYPPPPPPANGNVVSIAMQYLGVPYVWGGASPSGFDCSGLVMYVYAQVGVSLPHSAAAQYYAGTPVSYSELAPGDLVFFGSPISHVGIYIGGGSMIHAPFEGASVSIAGVGGGGSYAGACRI